MAVPCSCFLKDKILQSIREVSVEHAVCEQDLSLVGMPRLSRVIILKLSSLFHDYLTASASTFIFLATYIALHYNTVHCHEYRYCTSLRRSHTCDSVCTHTIELIIINHNQSSLYLYIWQSQLSRPSHNHWSNHNSPMSTFKNDQNPVYRISQCSTGHCNGPLLISSVLQVSEAAVLLCPGDKALDWCATDDSMCLGRQLDELVWWRWRLISGEKNLAGLFCVSFGWGYCPWMMWYNMKDGWHLLKWCKLNYASDQLSSWVTDS